MIWVSFLYRTVTVLRLLYIIQYIHNDYIPPELLFFENKQWNKQQT